MRIRWTTEACDQLTGIVKYVGAESADAASKVAHSIITAIDRLEAFPYLGRPGEVEGTCELVSSPYVIVYRIRSDIIEILHIWHGAQDWR